MKKYILNLIGVFKEYPYKLDLIWFLLIPVLNINYFIANNLYSKGYDIGLSIDKMIPFVPIFIIPYVFWYAYVVIGLMYFLVKRNRTLYMRTFISIFIGLIISYIIFYIFPTQYTRPIVNDTSLINKLILLIYNADKPFNCFPSLHVLVTYFIMRYTPISSKKLYYGYVQVVGTLIILSTLFIKQHFILDIFISMIIVEIIIASLKLLNNYIFDSILNIPYNIAKRFSLNSIFFDESNSK